MLCDVFPLALSTRMVSVTLSMVEPGGMTLRSNASTARRTATCPEVFRASLTRPENITIPAPLLRISKASRLMGS